MQKIIDVSEWNGYVDWQAVKDLGYHAILRLGYGSDFANQDDKTWAYNVSKCEELEIPWGAYIYSYAASSGQATSEVQHCLRLLEGHKPSYPIFIDLEESELRYCAHDNAVQFCEEMSAAGYNPGFYSMDSWFTSTLGNIWDWPRWIAHYGVDKPWYDCDIFQYTSTEYAPWCDLGRCDMNYLYNDTIRKDEEMASKEEIANATMWEILCYKNERMNGNKDLYQLITDIAKDLREVKKELAELKK